MANSNNRSYGQQQHDTATLPHSLSHGHVWQPKSVSSPIPQPRPCGQQQQWHTVMVSRVYSHGHGQAENPLSQSCLSIVPGLPFIVLELPFQQLLTYLVVAVARKQDAASEQLIDHGAHTPHVQCVVIAHPKNNLQPCTVHCSWVCVCEQTHSDKIAYSHAQCTAAG